MKKTLTKALTIALLGGFAALTTSNVSAQQKSMRDILPLPPTIYDASGNEVATESLRGKTVALYFSAHWCVPCRHFTPKLVDFYNQNKSGNFEVVFMSLDRSDRMKKEYMHDSGMKWLTAPGQGSKEINHIMDFYKLQGVPSLIVFGPNGELITKNGRADVTNSPNAALRKWQSKVAGNF
ncbi:MAG: thioredoxin family protein [Verrucomicrobiales bacterium]|nr:thioredoxin family protein [Verrucomicrobiales bacterium]